MALALTFATFTTVNAAIPKSGGSCAKKGLVSIYKNKKYTCIKSGNKFIWDSGIAIQPKNPAPLPSISSSAVPTPSNSPTTQPSATPTGPKSGDNCENIGSRIPLTSNTYLECRMVSGGKLRFFTINPKAVPPLNTTSLGNMKDCQVPDQTNRPPGATPVGYKTNRYQNPSYPTEGNFKIVILPIDFSDVPGEALDKNVLDKYVNIIEKWYSYESNGKLKVTVSYVDKWLRAPKPSQKYNWNHPGTQNPTNLTDDQIGQDFADIADPYVDFRNVGAFFVMHPNRIKTIEYGTLANVRVNTAEGAISPYVVANGFMSDRQDGALWAYWIHEFMHHVGITGHAPDHLWGMDLMTLQSGFGLSTTTWNQLLIDWLPANQLYCRTIDNLKSDILTLTSIDSLNDGIKSAMIAVSSHEVLVIESRRKDFWSSSVNTLVNKEAFDGFYGVLIYLVDTTKTSSNFDLDITAPDYDPTKYRFAYNLKISSNHINEYKGVWNLDYLMLYGESVEFRNIRISLIDSGDFDTIKIEKI